MLRLIVLTVVGTVVFMFLVVNMTSDSRSPPTSGHASTAIAMNAAMKSDVAAAMRSFCYNCPSAKLAWAKGEDAYGTVTKVFCGPGDHESVYSNAVFRVTSTPDDRVIVRPWD